MRKMLKHPDRFSPARARYLHFFAFLPSFPSGTGPGRPTPVGSRPSPFDVAAVFVHQRQRSVRSHSAVRHWLNPSARPGRGRIVCFAPGGGKHVASFTPPRPAAEGTGVSPVSNNQTWSNSRCGAAEVSAGG